MKIKQVTIAVTLLVISQSAFTQGLSPGAHSSLSIALSPMTTAQSTSGGLDYENDILLVKQDAMIALETGIVSDDLASVMAKMQTVDSMLSGLTDEQLLLVIIQTNKLTN
jgi:hypothetical protein